MLMVVHGIMVFQVNMYGLIITMERKHYTSVRGRYWATSGYTPKGRWSKVSAQNDQVGKFGK